ncbi:MAG: hypothetical protein HY831_03630 [Candidatus Aenigmarchaeota archaeon]|nr:hypothetical protein [Candidatus Aenigmarchaeota archaeon]
MATQIIKQKNLLIIGAVVVLIAFIVFFSTSFEEETVKYDMKLSVMENVTLGISNDNFELNFGRIPLNGKSTKFVSISYNSTTPSKIHLETTGNISKFIILEKNDFIIEKSDKFGIIANGTEYGNYTGTLIINIKKPRNQLSRLILGLV